MFSKFFFVYLSLNFAYCCVAWSVALGGIWGRGGELPGKSNDSRVSDVGSAHTDPIDKDTPDDGFGIFSNVPAVRRDVGVVLRATPLDAGVEEGGEEGGYRYCLRPCWAKDL